MSDVGIDQLAAPELRIRLMGRFEVVADTALRLPAGKATTLVQLLAVRRGSLVPVDVIVDALWGDSAGEGAAQNVASLVSRLRRVLGTERIVGGRTGYRFETAGCWVDVDEAERLLKEAESQERSGRPALAAAAAAQARQLLDRGELLEDEPYAPWAADARRETERLVRRARRATWTAALALGETRVALDMASRAVEADPLDEEAHRARMLALYMAGDVAAALAAHERLRRALIDELGADPGPETEALYVAILRSEAVAPPTVADAQQARPSAANDPIGREAEISTLTERWAAAAGGRWGTVVVSGPVGSGKTSVVAALAERARGREAVSCGRRAKKPSGRCSCSRSSRPFGGWSRRALRSGCTAWRRRRREPWPS